jgi:hypothetical protein
MVPHSITAQNGIAMAPSRIAQPPNLMKKTPLPSETRRRSAQNSKFSHCTQLTWLLHSIINAEASHAGSQESWNQLDQSDKLSKSFQLAAAKKGVDSDHVCEPKPNAAERSEVHFFPSYPVERFSRKEILKKTDGLAARTDA